ncbi:MAG UNVERIFIED_CONTAM: hypothetical protein LVQ98_08690 [Rickettsiaceae bacterium]|jgi:hypothetical protein
MTWDTEKNTGLDPAAKEFGDTQVALFNSKKPEQTQTQEKKSRRLRRIQLQLLLGVLLKMLLKKNF